MKLATADLPKLQFSVLIAGLMIAVGIVSIYLTLDLSESAELAQRSAQAERNDIDGKLRRVRNEENEIRQKSALFSKLQKQGVIGDEQRLEWVELLKDIRDQRRLIDLHYEIAPQHRLTEATGDGFSFYSSTMKLQLKLLHEEDLTHLLNDLGQRAKALIQVKSCSIARLPHGFNHTGAASVQLQADCQIDWVTLREESSNGGGKVP